MNGSCDARAWEVGLWTGWWLADREAYAVGVDRLREITGLVVVAHCMCSGSVLVACGGDAGAGDRTLGLFGFCLACLVEVLERMRRRTVFFGLLSIVS